MGVNVFFSGFTCVNKNLHLAANFGVNEVNMTSATRGRSISVNTKDLV